VQAGTWEVLQNGEALLRNPPSLSQNGMYRFALSEKSLAADRRQVTAEPVSEKT
jgi:hypothetical protein